MKRICRIIITLCLPILLCGPVMAQHSGPYAGALLGANVLIPAEASDNKGSFSLEFDPSLHGSAILGWDLAPLNPIGEGRIEIEYTHRSNQLDNVDFADGNIKASGKVKSDCLLLNVFGVYRNNTRWSPYAGVGIGAARMEASGLSVTGGSLGSGTSTVFAFQLGTGVDYAMTDSLSLDLGYRFFGSVRPTFKEVNGQEFKMDYYSHSAILGFRYGF